MTTSNILNCSTSNEARQMAISFARANNFQVTSAITEIDAAWMQIMSEIHSNNKTGNYEAAALLTAASDALKVWA